MTHQYAKVRIYFLSCLAQAVTRFSSRWYQFYVKEVLKMFVVGIECPILETPSHGIIVFKSTEKHVDDIANYTCDPGYDLNMDRNTRSFTIQCLQPVDIHQCLGSWSERPPCCIRKTSQDFQLAGIFF